MSGRGSSQTTKRSLPSWMSTRESNKSDEEFKGDGDSSKTNRSSHKRTREDNGAAWQNSEDSNTKNFSKLLVLEGVVFVLSGFVNPERGMLRSQALEMGAEYQQDWNSNCTLLVCAFPNTPKFRQVEAQCGTIVSKEWIAECHTQMKLVDIDSYLMHAGKPWRKSNTCHVLSNDDSTSPSREAQEQDKGLGHEASRAESSNSVGVELSPTKVKKWAADDLNKTMAWLESQDEKPEADELKEVAAEGVLTCLQDAIDLLKQKQDLSQIRDQWSIIPRVVEELIRSGSSERTTVTSQHHLHRRALSYKKMYEDEFRKMEGNSNMKGKSANTNECIESNSRKDRSGILKTEYDSDDTIEMTEEEINLAFRNISQK